MEVVAACNLAVSFFFLAVVYSSRSSGVFAVDDFTCVTKPKVQLDAEDTFIAGFFVNLAGGSLSIARTQYTSTTGSTDTNDRSLPRGSTQDATAVDGDVSVSVLWMPASGGVSRIGVYACEATRTGAASTSSIGTVIMRNEADFLPTAISKTVNSGDAGVRLEVTATGSRRDTIWRKNSSPPQTSHSNYLYYGILVASSNNAGTYEVHGAGDRRDGKQALMRLLVRECEQNKWSTPSCIENCPVCFNGGVCDDVGGLCICPPGFSGDFCEIVLGPNRFGKDGSLRCDSGLLPGTTSCEGMLFCLPDPFGCICAAGYKGIDCNTECEDGTFGANCAHMCHCSGQVACNKATGQCPDGCPSGYKGINCQDSCGAGVGGLDCATSCEAPAVVTLLRDVTPSAFPTQIHLAWKFVSNLCAVERYQIAHKLTNRDQCLEGTLQRVEVTSELYADGLIIPSGILPFSSYIVYIKAWNEIGDGPETSISVTTGEKVPTGEPENAINSSGQTNSLSFTWDHIPCGSRHGVITRYHYNLQEKDVSSNVQQGQVVSQAVTLNGLLPCTNYVFKVAGLTSAGQGPYSTSVDASTTVQVPDPVEGLTLVSTMNDIQVTWQASAGNANNPCIASSYGVTYELLNIDQCDPQDSPVTMNAGQVVTTTTTISGLEPYSSYKVYVRATNIEGNSLVVHNTVRTAEIVPTGQPENAINSGGHTNSLSFSWDPIPCGSRHGVITRYHYSLQEKDVSSNVQQGQVVLQAVTLSGLLPCTNYIFQVAGLTSAGQGPYSTSVDASTTVQAPGSVTMLEATVRSDPSQVVVTWQEPDGDCPVDGYTLVYELKNRDQCDDAVGSNEMQLNAQSPRTITSLYSHSTYSISVNPANSGGSGPQVSIEVTTLGSAPSGPPRDIKSTVVTNTTLSSSWDQPECGRRNGIITQYSYTLTNTADGTMRSSISSSTSLDLTNLVPFTLYTLSVAAVNNFGSGPVAVITNQTDEGIPPAPNNIDFPITSSNEITVQWSRPNPPHGIIVSYEIRYWKADSETSSSSDLVRFTDGVEKDLQTKEITNLEGNKGYSFQLRAETGVGFGAWSNVETAFTVPGTPSKPELLMVSSVTETSISLTWGHPLGLYPNGNMLKYKIGHRVVFKPYDSSFTFNPAALFENQEISDMSDLSGTVMNLEPSTKYELQVYGINDANIIGDKASILHFTAIATDLPPPEKPSLIVEESTSTSIAIRLVVTRTSKYITAYQIGVQTTNAMSRRSAPDFGHYRDNPSAYIAAEFSNGLPETFIVGDNKEYGSYLNAPLQEGAVFEISVCAVSRINETEANVVWNDDPLTIEVPKIPPTRQSNLLIIVICVVISAVVIVVGVMLYTQRRRKRRRPQPLQHHGINAGQELVSYETTITQEEKPTSASSQGVVSLVQESIYEPVGSGSSALQSPEPSPTYEDVGLPTWAHPWSVLWNDMMVGNKVLGSGHFGEVRYGGVTIKGELCKAAIKKLKENASPADRENFLKELKTMTLHGSHPNLVRILGACQHEGTLYVASEYLSNGDLRCYLRKARSMDDDNKASLFSQKLLQFALGVAKGMQHLAASGVIHRDLAARNILLDDDLIAKVSDFGLSRGEDVYVQTSKTRVPTRWLSLESLTHQTYTSKSDVWSFGILLWEIATLGGTPYSGIKTQFLTSRLENGYRMPKPSNPDAKIYEVMLQCWQEDPNDRPSFKKLVSILETMADSNDDQIYMRLLPSSEKYLYVNIHPEFDDN